MNCACTFNEEGYVIQACGAHWTWLREVQNIELNRLREKLRSIREMVSSNDPEILLRKIREEIEK